MYTDIFYPSIQVMVATVRCEEIGNEKIASFTADEVIIDLKVHIVLDTWYMELLIHQLMLIYFYM